MQSFKNTKSKPIGKPPKMIKPYRYSKRNTIVFIILLILMLILAYKAGVNTVNEPIESASESATLEVIPTPTPINYPLTVCDPFTSQITDGEIIKECYVNITPTPTPKPAKQSYKPSDEEIVQYIQSKDWDASTAVRIAKSENFFNLNNSFDCTRRGLDNSDGSHDRGIFQINTIHKHISDADAYDCFKNIDWAYEIYKARGNWSAWSAFNNGSYLAHADTL